GVINPLLFGMDIDSIIEMEPEEYCARVLGAICEAAGRLCVMGGMLINYGQLPEAVLSSISRFFGVSWSEAESEIMRSATRHHSKNPGVIYQQDSLEKKTKASERMREAAS